MKAYNSIEQLMDRPASSEVLAVAGVCENCGRDTDYLFDGLRFQMPAAQIREMDPLRLAKMKFLCEPFLTDRAMVCLRCRPLSNLEAAELAKGAPKIAKELSQGITSSLIKPKKTKHARTINQFGAPSGFDGFGGLSGGFVTVYKGKKAQ